MDYQEFKKDLLSKLEEINSEDRKYEISIQKMLKNNGLKLDGLTIREVDNRIAPVIYLEEWYEEYLRGKGMDEISKGIFSLVEKALGKDCMPPIPELNWESVKDKLFISVINATANEELLRETPHRRIDDLAVIAKIKVEQNLGETASIRVTDSLLPMLMKTKDEILNQAISNTEKMNFTCKTMRETMMQLLGEDGGILEELFPTEDEPTMFVVSLPSCNDGASVLACKDTMSRIIEKIGDDCYILPSSIHEILLIPKNTGLGIEDLQDMVCDVNKTEVKASEILSNHVYQFNRKDKKLCIAKPDEDTEVKSIVKKLSLSI